MLIQRFLTCLSTYTKVGEKVLFCLKCKKNYNINCNYSKKFNYKPLSVLFFGTDEFALSSLKKLYDMQQKCLLRHLEVVTAYKGQENSTIKFAKDHEIILHNWPLKLKENLFDIGVVVSFGHLIPSKIIDSFPLGMINVHGSLLPKYRGAAPICHALMNGDTTTGISIMKIMPKRFDVGSILAQKEINIDPDDMYPDLYNKLANLGSDLLIETFLMLPDVLKTAKTQDEEKASYAPKITDKMSFINWKTMTAMDIYNLYRGLYSIEPPRAYFDDKVVKLLDIKLVPDNTKINCTQEKIPGLTIYDKKNKKLYVFCQRNSWITVGTVIIPGRRPQSATDFGSGYILNRQEKSCLFL